MTSALPPATRRRARWHTYVARSTLAVFLSSSTGSSLAWAETTDRVPVHTPEATKRSTIEAPERLASDSHDLAGEGPSSAALPHDGVDLDLDSVVASEVAESSSFDVNLDGEPTDVLALPGGGDKGGMTSQAISIPQGSAKIDGMGESFSAQMSTGLTNFSVPFSIPDPRGNVPASLGLAYSSSGGFGSAGVGWGVGVPFVARRTDQGIPSYDDRTDFHPNQDEFVFNGGQELVPICTVTGAGDCPCTTGADGVCRGGARAGEVMPPWSAGSMYFRPRVESDYSRFFWSPDRRTWRVQGKSGTTMELGVPLDGSNDVSALELNPDKTCNLNDPNPARGCEIYRWHLVRQYDAYGGANPGDAATLPTPNNVVVYRYFQDGGMAYLSDIFHTTPAATPTTTNRASYAHHVRLIYEERSDPTFSYRAGWRIDQRQRLRGVDVASKAFNESVAANRRMVQRYHLGYDPSSHVSLLQTLEVEGRCASGAGSNPNTIVREQDAQQEDASGALPDVTNCPRLPAMTFGYSRVAAFTTAGDAGVADLPGYEGFDERIRELAASPPHSIDDDLSDLFDFNSDSLPDVLVTAPGIYDGGHGVFFNGATGIEGFGSHEIVTIPGVLGADANVIKLSNLNVAFLDVDGDATIDILHMPLVKRYSIYRPVHVASGWTWEGRVVDTASNLDPKINLGRDGRDIQVVDVNFDGLVDVVASTGTELQTFFSLGQYPRGDGQFGHASRASVTAADIANDPVRACVPWSGQPVRFSDPEVRLADMNGDGIIDILRLRRGDIRYWPGRGNGFWGTGARDGCLGGSMGEGQDIAMSASPFYTDTQAATLRIDDVNGDGLDDLVQVRFDAVDVWLNVDGVGWTDRHVIFDTPASPTQASRVRLVDVNGSGTRDLLWGDGRNFRYIDLQGGEKPWLLTRIENGLGKSTVIEYSTSAREMLAAQSKGGSCDPNGKPWASPWCSKMPTVAHVVKRVTESDNLVVAGKPPCTSITEYDYRDPVFEGRQREFRGFRKARSKRVGDENSPTDFSESTFLLGECEDETVGAANNQVDDCAVSERWRDNPREALKGLPILEERYDEAGAYLSTSATTYRLRRLYVGLDGREVRHAFPSATRTILYDTAAGPSSSTATQPMTAIELELDEDPAWDPFTQPDTLAATVRVDRQVSVPVRASSGYAVIESSSALDFFGNSLVGTGRGCVGGPECPTADEKIHTFSEPFLPPEQETGWLWRSAHSYVRGSVHTENRRETSTSYNAAGDPLITTAELVGTVPLDRFRTTDTGAVEPVPSEAAPPNASIDGTILVSSRHYGQFGELTREEAANRRCRGVGYDTAYAVLATLETTFRDGCDNAPLSTSAAYDRGLGLITSAVDVQGQHTYVDFDSFGRPNELRRPHPLGAGVSVRPDRPSLKFEYFLPGAGNPVKYSIIHSRAQDGASAESDAYLDSFAYVDGLGRTVVTLGEADPAFGDDGSFIAIDLSEYDSKLAPRRKYTDFFTTADPMSFPIGGVPEASYGRQRHDAFGRPLQTFNFDGSVTLEHRYHALSSDAFDAADLEPGPRQGTPASVRQDGHGRPVLETERIHGSGAVEERTIRTQYLATGEPEVISRLRSGSPPVTRWLRYDSLGRIVLNVEPNTSRNFTTNVAVTVEPSPDGLKAWRYAYNDVGNLVGTSDARGCGANYHYDAAGRLRMEDYTPCQPHHGAYTLPNPTSGAGAEVVYIYDQALSGFPAGFTDSPPGYNRTSANLVGRLAAVFDRASTTWTTYDARGRQLRSEVRAMRADASFATAFSARYAPRWYSTDRAFDTSDREIATTTGARVVDLQGQQVSGYGFPAERSGSVVTTSYTKRGAIANVGGSYGALVRSVDHAADGIVNEIVYGDVAHTTTGFSYDNRRRLSSVQTYRGPPGLWSSQPPNYQPAPPPDPTSPTTFQLLLQDADFRYDSTDNPIEIRDWRNAEEWPAGAKPVTRKIDYDDLYRVARVSYEYPGGDDIWVSPNAAENANTPPLQDPRRAKPSPQVEFDRRLRFESFEYDWLGNTTRSADDGRGFYDRSLGSITNDTAAGKPYQLASATNRSAVASPRDGSLATLYDAAGNLTRLNVTRDGECLPAGALCSHRFAYDWDELGRLVRARRWDLASGAVGTPGATLPGSAPAADLSYSYDAENERVLKTAVAGSEQRHTLYLFASLELRRTSFVGGEYVLDSQTEVPYLFARGVRLARLVFEGPNDGEPRIDGKRLHVFLELADQLGSTNIVLDQATSELVEASTFQAYGASESDYRPERWNAFREDHRFTGKEEDVEVGLVYFGARFLSLGLNRWLSPDPLSLHAPEDTDLNLYAYVRGRVLQAVDPVGLADIPVQVAPGNVGRRFAPDGTTNQTFVGSALDQKAKEAGLQTYIGSKTGIDKPTYDTINVFVGGENGATLNQKAKEEINWGGKKSTEDSGTNCSGPACVGDEGATGETKTTAADVVDRVVSPLEQNQKGGGENGVLGGLGRGKGNSKLVQTLAIAGKVATSPVGGAARVAKTVAQKAAKGVAKHYVQRRIRKLAEANINNSGLTVLGHHGYVGAAQRAKASYFHIDKKIWNKLSTKQQEAANLHFLDKIAAKGDQVMLSTLRKDIRKNSGLAMEIEYLTKQKGYRWVSPTLLLPQ